jgi:hypothetical protein
MNHARIFPVSGIRQVSSPRHVRQRVKSAAVACAAALAWARAALVARSTGGAWPMGLARKAAVPKAPATMAQNATAQRDRAPTPRLRRGTRCVLRTLGPLAPLAMAALPRQRSFEKMTTFRRGAILGSGGSTALSSRRAVSRTRAMQASTSRFVSLGKPLWLLIE